MNKNENTYFRAGNLRRENLRKQMLKRKTHYN